MKELRTLTVVLLIMGSNFAFGQDLDYSLKAHYKFEENLLDETPFNNHLQIINGEINYSLVKEDDYAAVFNGNSQLHTISNYDNSDYTAISVSLWFKSSTITTDLQVMLQGAFLGFGIYIAPNSGKVIGFFDSSSAGSLASKEVLTDGEWHHIVLSSDGKITAMYVDGVDNGMVQEPMVVGSSAERERLYLGRSNLNVQQFKGMLNEVRIYSRDLSQEERDTLFTNPEVILPPKGETETNELNKNCEFQISPNPSQDFVQLTPESKYEYKVYTMDGRYVFRGTGSEIDFSKMASAVYLIQINGCIQKQIIQRN